MLQVQVGQEIQGPLAGLALLGEEEQVKHCLKEPVVGEAPAHGSGRAVLQGVLPRQGSVLPQPNHRVCNLVLSGYSSSKVLGWGGESSQQSGPGACHWPRNQPCSLSPSLGM